jgi:hypothetical protein
MAENTRSNPQQGPQHYVFIATSVEWEPFTSGRDVVETLARNNVWLASRYTPYRRVYKYGDRVLLYSAGPKARYFLGDAVVSGPVTETTEKEKQIAHRLGLEGFEERIPLEAVHLWENPLPLKPLVNRLQFIKDKKNWGLNLRNAAARIPEEDFQLILLEARQPPAEHSSDLRNAPAEAK